MKSTFRQSMAWLHIWAGLLTGWVLFFVFLTGTLGYVSPEITRWMTPEAPLASSETNAAHLVKFAQTYLEKENAAAQLWVIRLPDNREGTQLVATSYAWPRKGARYGDESRAILDLKTGQAASDKLRETGGGATLYRMHYQLRYLPGTWGVNIVGICAMFMLVAILSGVVTHKKILKDFFTFRPGKGQRSWLDAHNLLSVSALPFHIMITWSGLLFFAFAYMPVALDALYPGKSAQDKFFERSYGLDTRDAGTPAIGTAELAPMMPMVAQAEKQWGRGSVVSIDVRHPGSADSIVTINSRHANGIKTNGEQLRFDGVTGKLMPAKIRNQPTAGRFMTLMFALHIGRFAEPLMRVFYVASGLLGTGMIATGLLLWSTKRKAKRAAQHGRSFGMAIVDSLNLGTIIGLPLGIAGYFWANRLVPIRLDGRAAWEVHGMFALWGAAMVFSFWRPPEKAWVELCAATAFAYAALPLVDFLTTDRHLAIALTYGDWVLAGFDLIAFAVGLFFAYLGSQIWLKHQVIASPAKRRSSPKTGAVI